MAFEDSSQVFPQVITTADLSRETGLSAKYVCTLAKEGVIPAIKIGKRRWYFPVEQLREWLEKGGSRDCKESHAQLNACPDFASESEDSYDAE